MRSPVDDGFQDGGPAAHRTGRDLQWGETPKGLLDTLLPCGAVFHVELFGFYSGTRSPGACPAIES